MPANSSKPQDESGEAETPHYHGHRERLRERFYGAGPEALSDYELPKWRYSRLCRGATPSRWPRRC